MRRDLWPEWLALVEETARRAETAPRDEAAARYRDEIVRTAIGAGVPLPLVAARLAGEPLEG